MKKRKQLIFDVTNNGWLAGKGHVSVKSVTSWFSWGWLNKQHCQSNKTAVKVSPHLSQKKQQEKTHLHIATPSPTETSLCKQERSHIQFVIKARYGSVTWPPPSLLSTYCIDKSMPKMNGPNTMIPASISWELGVCLMASLLPNKEWLLSLKMELFLRLCLLARFSSFSL